MNSITRETDSSQATTATKQYDAFGMPLSSTGSSASPFGFAGCFGYQEDGDSGLKLLGHRYYDPSTGRFLTRDPAKDGRNWYGYCENGPLNGIDPDGHSMLDKAWNFICKAAETIRDGVTWGGTVLWNAIGIVLLVKPVVVTVITFEKGRENAGYRREYARAVNAAHESGKISDEKWYFLLKENAGPALEDGKGMLQAWWELVCAVPWSQ